jgi:hypothetical protein
MGKTAADRGRRAAAAQRPASATICLDKLSQRTRDIPLEVGIVLEGNPWEQRQARQGPSDGECPMNPKSPPTIGRRTVFVGAGVAGAVGVIAAATVRPGAAPAPQQTAAAPPDPAGGYQLTEHVKQYYATARI